MEESINIDIDSKDRDRNTHPNVSNFTIPYTNYRTEKTIDNSNDPISNAYPLHEWQWNSSPPITIINGGKGYFDATNVSVIGGSGTGMTVDIRAEGLKPLVTSVLIGNNYNDYQK